MKDIKMNFAVVVPMANEENDFEPFIHSLSEVLDSLQSGRVYFVIDKVSKDDTLKLCHELSEKDSRFVTIWAEENRNVVDAYIRGYKEALKRNHDYIIEMDAGLSHNPRSLPLFLQALDDGAECVFGSRFVSGGSLEYSSLERRLLSKSGTILSNLLLGTRMRDMTSGFQGFRADVVEKFITYELLSKAHFYQTELRYLLRKTRFVEVPISYRAPSKSVNRKVIHNALFVLFHYFQLRLRLRSPEIRIT